MKIGFCGTISVGKTTIVNALKELPEFVNYEFRTERSKYLRDLGIPLNTDSTLKGQFIFMAERSSELYLDNMITDRTIIDVMAFTRLANSIPYFMADALNDAAAPLLREYDYIFYVSPEGVELEDNGVRAVDAEYRMEICKKCQLYDIQGSGCMVPGTQPCCNEKAGGCGCSLAFKTRSLSSDCPLNKWKAILSEDEENKLNEMKKKSRNIEIVNSKDTAYNTRYKQFGY
jgi:hypothetical protein